MKLRFWHIAGIAAIVLLLVGGAFMAGRLLKAPAPGAGKGDGAVIMIQGGAGGGEVTVGLDEQRAKELPPQTPDMGGVFVRRQDNSLFLGTGNVQVEKRIRKGEPPEVALNYDGPVVELVVTNETVIYRDETEFALSNSTTSGTQKVQQVVKPGQIDEIEKDMTVTAWGEKRGDRIVARVLVYRRP